MDLLEKGNRRNFTGGLGVGGDENGGTRLGVEEESTGREA